MPEPPRQRHWKMKIHLVSSSDSPEFSFLTQALTVSSLIGLDAEWKPTRTHQPSLPAVTLLQIACRLSDDDGDECPVFLIDLLSIPLSPIWEMLRDVFVSPNILKLGFRFKQDLVYLSSTFCSHGCDPGFDKVEPYLDIMSIYTFLQRKQTGRRTHKESKSLANICDELLGISLSKELQCSDWSCRPLTEEQKIYAAMDALCLLDICTIFEAKILKQDHFFHRVSELHPPHLDMGLKVILKMPEFSNNILKKSFCEASDMIRAVAASECLQVIHAMEPISRSSENNAGLMDVSLLKIIREYGERIILNESDRKPKSSRKKGKKKSSLEMPSKEKRVEILDYWRGPPPWDFSLGGDGFPRFLCDVMVEGLAKHLRCVGIDAAVPYSKKPDARQLIEQAHREKRVLLTRDAKLLRHDYVIKNQVYRVKSLLKNEQLLEVIETFELKISEDQLMSRCTKCNGRFIQKPLTTEEAVEAAKGFQIIPDCLFNKNLEFWQCMDCNQLYWEGTQYHNAVQKFIDVCKLNEQLSSNVSGHWNYGP
ncbi:3'-5' exonuclease domain [Dillenia turbinata]|uniref:3'-5' exonuclease domain n=1 Tax=Dillenia turbinata TaxID=194707 RepID=A0AAN8VMT7_9MAGN